MVLQSRTTGRGSLMGLADLEARKPGRRPSSGPETIALSALPVGHEWRVGGLDENRVTAIAACYSRLPPVLVNRRDRIIVDGLQLEPVASLRAIAAELGVSPETVRSVRKHLDAGDAWSPEAKPAPDVG